MTSEARSYPSKEHLPSPEDIWRCLVCDSDVAGIRPPAVYGRYFQEYVRYMNWLKKWSDSCGAKPNTPPADQAALFATEGVQLYETSILQQAGTRRFVVTENESIGWAPPEAKVGDIVCVFLGAQVPHLLRLNAEDKLVLVGGDCYIHGQMEGEALRNAEDCIQTFAIY